MNRVITLIASAVFSVCVLGGLASAEPSPLVQPEPEPAGTCFGAQPICIGGSPCCRCEIGGINCVWACCR